MLSVHYGLLTMTHQSKTEKLDWYVICYLEYGNNMTPFKPWEEVMTLDLIRLT